MNWKKITQHDCQMHAILFPFLPTLLSPSEVRIELPLAPVQKKIYNVGQFSMCVSFKGLKTVQFYGK